MFNMKMKLAMRRGVKPPSETSYINAYIESYIKDITVVDASGAEGNVGLDYSLFKLAVPEGISLEFDNGVLVNDNLTGFSKPYALVSSSSTMITASADGDLAIKYNPDSPISSDTTFYVEVETGGSTLLYKKDGITIGTGISITGDYQLLSDGVLVKITGAVEGDTWEFTVTPDWYLNLHAGLTVDKTGDFVLDAQAKTVEFDGASAGGFSESTDDQELDYDDADSTTGILFDVGDLTDFNNFEWHFSIDGSVVVERVETLTELPYVRFADLRDFTGTVEDPTSLSDFYKLNKVNSSDLLTDYEGNLISGTINGGTDVFIRSYKSRQIFTDIIEANNEKRAIEGVVRAFVIEYNNLMNTEFSTYEGTFINNEEVVEYGS